MRTSILSPWSMCQSVISRSLTLRDTNIRDFGVKFYFSKIRMEPVMLSFLATTENIKRKMRTTELTIAGKLSNIYSGKSLFAISIIENESRAVLSDIVDQTNKRAEPKSTGPV